MRKHKALGVQTGEMKGGEIVMGEIRQREVEVEKHISSRTCVRGSEIAAAHMCNALSTEKVTCWLNQLKWYSTCCKCL